MPHATDDEDAQADRDDELISSLLDPTATNNVLQSDFFSRDLEGGDKADDAVDYGDISLSDDDDDLAEDLTEESKADGLNGHAGQSDTLEDIAGEGAIVDEEQFDDDLDALFGEQPSSPVVEAKPAPVPPRTSTDTNGFAGLQLPGQGLRLPGSFSEEPKAMPPPTRQETESPSRLSFRPVDYGSPAPSESEEEGDSETARLIRLQKELFAQAGRNEAPEPPKPNDDLILRYFPDFSAEQRLYYVKMFPLKRALYLGKAPVKPPKPIQPTKVNLELQQDQERAFRLIGPASSNKAARQAEAEARGITLISEADGGNDSSDAEIELDEVDENEFIGGVSWKDMCLACEDWDIASMSDYESDKEGNRKKGVNGAYAVLEDHSYNDFSAPPTKKRRLDPSISSQALHVYHDTFYSLDDPEHTTAQIAKKVELDLNDPHLLLDEIKQDAPPPAPRNIGAEREVSGKLTKTFKKRFNISNDEAYEALKENHQHKVRSTLGNLSIEHSTPAIKLQYPFYKLKLNAREARSFHRPALTFHPNQAVYFSKLKSFKRKHQKSKSPQVAFEKASDLSLGDNSNMLLLEYSEEYPTMLSNFGMGSRLINYYRRKDMDDSTRPKLDLGETQVLLPQDKSPFSIFGTVSPGETVPTLHNAMYRAPIFKHEPKNTDFLVGRSTTGIDGSTWYLRNIENLAVVGQEFPSVEVPGTHSRKVTETGKRRMRMIAYRIYAKQKHGNPIILSNEVIRQHNPGSDVAQNRGKMREFMVYDKEKQSWRPKPNEGIPDFETMRGWIKPEDICLIDSMQVGYMHLQDAGYHHEESNSEEPKEEKEGASVDEQMAPWVTTKNFLNACQGKAMLKLHGEGDPSGRGEAFSFIKTSMKGGFKAIGESVEDKLDAKRLKELGGHSYNVARQQRAYDDAIKRIWEAQHRSLSSTLEHSDSEMDVDEGEDGSFIGRAATPRSAFGTPAFPRHDDETTSQFSRMSAASQSGKVLRIKRSRPDEEGNMIENEEVITDPKVIREYTRRKKVEQLSRISLADIKPTGDAEFDAQQYRALEIEHARLVRNKERRFTREKAKGIMDDSIPGTPGSPTAGPSSRSIGTQRKCANCGQVGHIKTNKKLCPMLNGKMKQNDGFNDQAFGAVSAGAPAGSPR
ncbi:hypothetical protein BDY21DRAFT_338291 [Lineolata rhizophorae]|uniref:Transcription initiation factor TFIID subunit 1 histone acetyltransferase domain-containing protein n=1 Tax=Lineolata rhizophorae TaxID=578093 RepID=A0A6A6P6E9_9PEZI|nr:hypothetical protein BDY21DRAFT_338291 [Lineolata rhizophorae]